MDDVVAAGRERGPLPTPWRVAGVVLLVLLAVGGTWRTAGRPSRPPRHPAASPGPTDAVAVPPLETMPPDWVYAESAIQRIPPDGPALRLVLVTETGRFELDTGTDVLRSLGTPPSDGLTAVVPGVGADFWTVPYDGRTAQHRDAGGRPLGRAVRLPDQVEVLRGTVAGLLIADGDDDVRIRVWDPSARRTVRTIARHATVVSHTPRHVAWQPPCGPRGCTLHVTEVATGADRVVPTPPGFGQVVQVAASNPSVAYVWQHDGTASVHVVTADATEPAVIAPRVPGSVFLAWTGPGRLAIVQDVGLHVLVYGWSGEMGLWRGGAYEPGWLDAVYAAAS